MPIIELSESAPCPTKVSGRQCLELKNALEENKKLQEKIRELKEIVDDLREQISWRE